MKRKLLFVLAMIILLLPWKAGTADVLCAGWWNSDMDDLQAARNQICEIVHQPLSEYGTTISDTVIFLDGWKSRPTEELQNALLQLENQIVALGGALPSAANATPPPTYTPVPNVTATVASATDPTTEKYSVYAMYALKKFFGVSWKNPDSVQIHGISVFVFPEGFEKEYENSDVDDDTLLFLINYSAQNGFGGMNREDYIVRMLTDLVDEMRNDPNYDSILKAFAIIGQTRTGSGWIPKLYTEVMCDVKSGRKLYELDMDYILTQYESYKFEEWIFNR